MDQASEKRGSDSAKVRGGSSFTSNDRNFLLTERKQEQSNGASI